MSGNDNPIQAAWNAKFEEIVAHIGRTLYGEGPLTHEQDEQARDEAEDAVEAWEEAAVSEIGPIVADTDLKRLLAEQHDIAEGILDARDARLTDDDKDVGLDPDA